MYEDDYSCTDSVISKETSKNLNLIEINYSMMGKGKEIKTGESFEIGPVSSPLDPEPIIRKCYSFNGETSIHNDSIEDTIFHRTVSSYM